MSMFNTLDYIIFVIALVGGLWGAIKGCIDEFSQKFGYVAGFACAMIFTLPVSEIFRERLNFPQWVAAFASYVILFMVGFLLIKALGTMLTNIFETAHLSAINNILGFFLGIVETLLVLGLIETALSFQSFVSVGKLFDESWVSSNILLPICKSLVSSVNGLV